MRRLPLFALAMLLLFISAAQAGTWYRDADGDGAGSSFGPTLNAASPPAGWVENALDCDDGNSAVHVGAYEVCGNGVDEDCNGVPDDGACTQTWFHDADGDGWGSWADTYQGSTPPPDYVGQGGDCADQDSTVHPYAPEICGDLIDNNCDGIIDNTCSPIPDVNRSWSNVKALYR